jgi:hypothetical protein
MAKTFVSAVHLSDIFANRLRDMHPLSRILGIKVFALGDGEWMPSAFVEPIPVTMIADVDDIIVRMRAEFLLDA